MFKPRRVGEKGPAREPTFEMKGPDGGLQKVPRRFDMLHVCPPQTAPDFVRSSPLAGDTGWIDVDQQTLRHTRFANIFSLGDVCSAPNSKTMAAARKQAPIVAEHVLAVLDSKKPRALYDGYGSCPLTVERGRIVLAEFGYGGKLLPTFPKWLCDGTRPSRLAWLLKERILPPVYWQGMLKGREWLAAPRASVPSPDDPGPACKLNSNRVRRAGKCSRPMGRRPSTPDAFRGLNPRSAAPSRIAGLKRD